VVSQSQLVFSDYLGDRRLFVQFNSVASFSDFNIIYMNLSRRFTWGATVYDNRTFFLGIQDNGELTRRSAFRQTGVAGFVQYPFNFYNRAELSLGYLRREYEFPRFIIVPGQSPEDPPRLQQTGEVRKDSYPELGFALVGDTTIDVGFGPISGHRWRLDTSYAPDIGGNSDLAVINRDSNAITASAALDFRQYLPITRRTEFAFRFFGGASWGQVPDVYYFGGLDDMRGFNFRQFVGDRAFYTNFEFRFPLVEALALPFLTLQGIRGRVFLDVGGAWFAYDGEKFDWWDNDNSEFPSDNPFLRTRGPKAAYGWGFTINFLGLDLNWDFAKQYRFETAASRYQTTFWIGTRF
jgi:outer membrane protein assembly factor BamA